MRFWVALILSVVFAGHARSDSYEWLQRIQESCQKVSYSAPVGTIDRSIVRIEVAFDETYFEEEPSNEVGTAFVIDKDLGLLATALHTLLPGASVKENDCKNIALAPEFLEVTTAVFRQSGPIMEVPMEIVKDGWDGCRDTALLKVDPELLSNAVSLDIAREIPPASEALVLYKASESEIPAASHPLVPVNLTTAPRLTDPKICREWIPDCCERGICRLASGPIARGGISGAPILDRQNRFVGMVVRSHDNSVDTSWVLAPRSIEAMLLSITSLDQAELDQIVSWTKQEAYAQLANGNNLSNLEFMKFIEELLSNANLLGLDAADVICPIAAVADERGLGERYSTRLKTHALASLAKAQEPSKSKRAVIREIGQEFTRIAYRETNAGNVGAAIEAASLAEVAYSQSIALFMHEGDVSPLVSALAQAMPGTPQSDIATYASVLSVGDANLSWNFDAEPQKNRVFSAMLREYADVNAFIARTGDESDPDRAALAATAAYWSAAVSDSDVNRARSLRTLGDAYVVGLEPDTASIAYATASTLAANSGNPRLSSSTLARMIESAEIAGITVPKNSAKEIAIEWPERAVSPHSADSLIPAPYSAIQALDRQAIGWTGRIN